MARRRDEGGEQRMMLEAQSALVRWRAGAINLSLRRSGADHRLVWSATALPSAAQVHAVVDAATRGRGTLDLEEYGALAAAEAPRPVAIGHGRTPCEALAAMEACPRAGVERATAPSARRDGGA